MSDELIFYTNPMSRGRIVRWMLEEVGQPYRTEIMGYESTMKGPEYLAINPMGKVPAVRHGEEVVTECGAICAYLADAFPQAGLAPPLGAAGDHQDRRVGELAQLTDDAQAPEVGEPQVEQDEVRLLLPGDLDATRAGTRGHGCVPEVARELQQHLDGPGLVLDHEHGRHGRSLRAPRAGPARRVGAATAAPASPSTAPRRKPCAPASRA